MVAKEIFLSKLVWSGGLCSEIAFWVIWTQEGNRLVVGRGAAEDGIWRRWRGVGASTIEWGVLMTR